MKLAREPSQSLELACGIACVIWWLPVYSYDGYTSMTLEYFIVAVVARL